jgi:adenylyl- and sulfurtransferase ThiI
VALVGWSGIGGFADLRNTVVRKLSLRAGEVDRVGNILLVATDDPVVVARKLSFLPGVSWIAVGYRFSGIGAYLRNLEAVSKRYLSKGKTFRISAEVFGSTRTAGDIILAGNSALLSSIPGTRVNEKKPQVTFRVCLEGQKVVCGAEIRSGPGGGPHEQRLGHMHGLRRRRQLRACLDGGASGFLVEARPF